MLQCNPLILYDAIWLLLILTFPPEQEMLAIPLVLVVLVTVWMQLIRGQGKTGLDFEEAYNDARANEVDSGTEPEEDEIEEKGEEEKKED